MTLVLGLLTSGLSVLLELFVGAAIARFLCTLLKSPPIRKAGAPAVLEGKKLDYFELQIWLPGQGPLRDMIRAESLRQALAFARNRYPGCLVEVPETPAKLRPLSKSYNGAESERLRKLKALKNERN